MDSERWKQVDNLLQSALDRPPEERDAFLRQACAGDEALEREVRSLLTSERAGRRVSWRARRSKWPRAPSLGRAEAAACRHPDSAGPSPTTASSESWAAAEWAWSTRPRTPACTASSLSSSCPDELARDPEALESLPARGPRRFRLESSEHLHHLRHRRAGRPLLHRHGVSGWNHAEAPHRRPPAGDRNAAAARPSRSPTPWTPRTPRESSIATSSPRTFSSPRAVTRRFSILDWRKSSGPAVAQAPARRRDRPSPSKTN